MMGLEQNLNLYYLLREALIEKIAGDVVKIGCYRGWTSFLFQKTLIQFNSEKKLHVYDSFQGLGEKSDQDLLGKNHQAKKVIFLDNRRVKERWFQCPKEEFPNTFQSLSIPLPEIHEGWIEDTIPEYLPEQISFAHIDLDFYLGTKRALQAIFPRLSEGAIVIVDDYCDPDAHKTQNSLPGVKFACDEFLKDKTEKMELLSGGREFHACFTKGNSSTQP